MHIPKILGASLVAGALAVGGAAAGIAGAAAAPGTTTGTTTTQPSTPTTTTPTTSSPTTSNPTTPAPSTPSKSKATGKNPCPNMGSGTGPQSGGSPRLELSRPGARGHLPVAARVHAKAQAGRAPGHPARPVQQHEETGRRNSAVSPR